MAVLADSTVVAAYITGIFAIFAAVVAAVLGVVLPRTRASRGAREGPVAETNAIRFDTAAGRVFDRLAKIRACVDAPDTTDAELALRSTDDEPLSPSERTLRREVWLLGEDIDMLSESWASCPDRPPLDEFEAVRGPLRALVIAHRLSVLDDAAIRATLTSWCS